MSMMELARIRRKSSHQQIEVDEHSEPENLTSLDSSPWTLPDGLMASSPFLYVQRKNGRLVLLNSDSVRRKQYPEAQDGCTLAPSMMWTAFSQLKNSDPNEYAALFGSSRSQTWTLGSLGTFSTYLMHDQNLRTASTRGAIVPLPLHKLLKALSKRGLMTTETLRDYFLGLRARGVALQELPLARIQVLLQVLVLFGVVHNEGGSPVYAVRPELMTP